MGGRDPQLLKEALAQAPGAEPWPGHFTLRWLEFQTLAASVNLENTAQALEIGCGSGFGAAMLATKAKLVVATDLPQQDPATGLASAAELVRLLGLNNCRLLGARAEHLPFPAESFDLVFSSFVLEHIKDKERALTEIRRVLRTGGLAISFVPGFAGSLYSPFALYLHLAKLVFDRLCVKLSRGKAGPSQQGFSSSAQGKPERGCRGLHPLPGCGVSPPASLELGWGDTGTGYGTGCVPRNERTLPSPGAGGAAEGKSGLRRLRQLYPHFPLPNPHGAYNSYWEELVAHLPNRWIKLFQRNGFAITHTFSTMVLPVNILWFVMGEKAIMLYQRVAALDKRLGKLPIIKWLGQCYCIVARKV